MVLRTIHIEILIHCLVARLFEVAAIKSLITLHFILFLPPFALLILKFVNYPVDFRQEYLLNILLMLNWRLRFANY